MLVSVVDLKKYFRVYGGIIPKPVEQVLALDGVSFTIEKGEAMGLVGESGCGKTTLGRTILRLISPTSGEVYFNGKNIFKLGKEELRHLRPEMQMIFQDPFSSLNPRMTVQAIVEEAVRARHGFTAEEMKNRVAELFDEVGLHSYHFKKYPHQLSGGEKQRVAILRALAPGPKFIVSDEPVSSLDVSIRAHLLNLLTRLQKRFELAFLHISHDLSVVRQICDKVAVMYLGKIVEMGSTEDLYDDPKHLYTQALLSATPIPDPEAKIEQIILKGEVPSALRPPPGCRFHPRCFIRDRPLTLCSSVEPKLTDIGNGHSFACHMIK